MRKQSELSEINEPRVSVILPIYNGEKTLEVVLQSLLSQTYQNFEVIACLDGSTDRSDKILGHYKSKFTNLKILENRKNRGLGPTMNRLVSEAKGVFVAVAEQDDYYYPYRLEKQVDVLESNEEVGLVSGIAEFWDGEKVTFQFPGLLVHGKQYPLGRDMFLLNYREQIKVVNSCMMFRKSIHINNGLYFSMHYPNIPIDWAYILRFSLISQIYGIHKVLVRLDRRKERKSVTSNKAKRFLASRELIRSFAYEYPEVIGKKDFNYAKRTQLNLEYSQYSGFKFVFAYLFLIFRFPMEIRFRKQLIKRLKRKFI